MRQNVQYPQHTRPQHLNESGRVLRDLPVVRRGVVSTASSKINKGFNFSVANVTMNDTNAEDYVNDGYTMVDSIVPPALLSRVRSETDRLIAAAAGETSKTLHHIDFLSSLANARPGRTRSSANIVV